MVTTAGLSIDSDKAKEIAERFLEQHYSVHGMKIILKNGIWIVKVQISGHDQNLKKLRIDSKTGKIISVE